MTETEIKQNLALAYQILAHLGLDDLTYTHLSARVPGEQAFFIYPFGLLFEEVTPETLLKVTLDGEILEGYEQNYNKTGYVIHGSIYQKRPDLNAIFHLHTHSSVAVSCLKEGLLPLSQWALHFYEKIAYHQYNSLALNLTEHGDLLAADLGSKNVMLMRNHGMLTCGKTIHEALFYCYHLEQACKTQCLLINTNRELVVPSKEICQKSVLDLLSFEKDLGKRDWDAWQRKISKK